jgi:exosortase/archaeosortase family protein
LALFAVTFGSLQFGWQAARGGVVESLVIHDLTVRPAAWLANFLTPGVQATAEGFTVRAPGGGLNVLNGCEGVEVLFLLLAAFVAGPLPPRRRMLGIAVGVPLIFALNQARIVGLFYAYRADHALFDTLHGTVAPILLVLVVACYFYAWLDRSPGTRAGTA